MLVNFLTGTLSHEHEAQAQGTLASVALDRIVVIILGGGEGKRLAPLTKTRCKPTMSFGGRYSLIDIPISHSLSSGLTKIFVIGQYLAYTLQKHLYKSYLHEGASTNQVQLLVPEEREGKRVWYQGTADAIRQNLEYLSEIPADYFLILSGDQLYNINFQEMIRFGLEVDAGMLIAAKPVAEKEAKRMGLLKIEHGGSRIIDFYEKPQDKQTLKKFKVDDFTLQHLGADAKENKHFLGSMGIYFFKRQTLFDLLLKDLREDFGKHLITTQMEQKDVHAFLYDGYWEDIGTIESYYHANLALTEEEKGPSLGLQCYNEKEIIFTKKYSLPGAKVTNCRIKNSLLCEGTILEGAEIVHSIMGVRTVIRRGTTIRDTIFMGNEYYERPTSVTGEPAYRPEVGEGCTIEKAIIDENVSIGRNVRLVNSMRHVNYDSPDGKVFVRDGIIVVPRGTHIPDFYTF